MSTAGFFLTILGIAGIGGAIDRSESLLLPIIATAAGMLVLYIGEKKRGGHKEDKKHFTGGSNCHNYPAGLEHTRRRA